MAKKMTIDEKAFFDYMFSMHAEDGGCSKKEATRRAMFDVDSRRSVGNPPWHD